LTPAIGFYNRKPTGYQLRRQILLFKISNQAISYLGRKCKFEIIDSIFLFLAKAIWRISIIFEQNE